MPATLSGVAARAPGIVVARFEIAVPRLVTDHGDQLDGDDDDGDGAGPVNGIGIGQKLLPKERPDRQEIQEAGEDGGNQQSESGADEKRRDEHRALPFTIPGRRGPGNGLGQCRTDADMEGVNQCHSHRDGGVDAEFLHPQNPDGDGNGNQAQNHRPQLGEQ